MIFIGILLIVISAASKAMIDVLNFHFYKSVVKNMNSYFWNPNYSWTNKYKYGDPKNGPKFFLSTTVLSWTTDAWHLFQMIYLKTLVAGTVIITMHSSGWAVLVNIIVAMVLFGFVFEIFYKYVFRL